LEPATSELLLAFADLVADNSANSSAAKHSDRAAKKKRATDRANSSAGCRVRLACVHAGASAQAQEHYRGSCIDQDFLHRIHRISFSC
jgi:hypothetical protein